MRKYSYRWKIRDQIYEGHAEYEDEQALCVHIKELGGDLVEITSTKEVSHDFSQGSGKAADSKALERDQSHYHLRWADPIAEPSDVFKFIGWAVVILGVVLLLVSLSLNWLIWKEYYGENREHLLNLLWWKPFTGWEVAWPLFCYLILSLVIAMMGLGIVFANSILTGILFFSGCAMLMGSILLFAVQAFILGGISFVAAAGFFWSYQRFDR